LTQLKINDIFKLSMKKASSVLALTASLSLVLGSLFLPSTAHASNFTLIKDTLQSSRLSFNGRVKAPTVAGSSHVWMNTVVSGNFTSISTAGLKPGDSVQIGTTNTYTISTIVDDDEFTVTPVLISGDADVDDPIYYRARPQHTITFTTPSAIANGFFQVLLPGSASSGNDNIADNAGFDLTGSAVTLTPTNIANYTFSNNAATAAGATGCTAPAGYHCFEFHYSGAGSIGANITLVIGQTDGINTPIAPAPKTSRVIAQADTYTYYIRNFVNGSNPNIATPTDDGAGSIAFIEGVRVTATVDPSITFKIEGIASTTTACGVATDVTTTSYSVPFGIMALDTFKTAAQKITVSTNAVSGYAVTAIENERMSNLAGSPSYIPDTTCDAGCPGAWTSGGNSGLGFTTAIVSGAPTLGITSPNFREFSSLAATEAPFQIMSNTTIASLEAIHVCYKLAVGATQPAGDYENQITYTATATF